MASQSEEHLIWNRLLYKEKPSLRQLVLTLQEATHSQPLSKEKKDRAMDDLEELEFSLDKLDLIRLANSRDISEYEELALSLGNADTVSDLGAAKRDSDLLAERLTKAQQLQSERIKNEAVAAEINKLRSQEDLQTHLKAVRDEARRENEAIYQMEMEIAQKQQSLQSLWQLLQQLTRTEES